MKKLYLAAQQRKVNSRQQNSKNPIRGNVNFVAGNKRPPRLVTHFLTFFKLFN